VARGNKNYCFSGALSAEKQNGTNGNRSGMAHHKSALKRIRQTEHRTEVNRSRRSRIKTFIRKVELAVLSGDKTQAQEAFRAAEPEIMRGVSKGVLKIGTAARKISRLSARVKALS
jgi:small subunit ribosomal protein S20